MEYIALILIIVLYTIVEIKSNRPSLAKIAVTFRNF